MLAHFGVTLANCRWSSLSGMMVGARSRCSRPHHGSSIAKFSDVVAEHEAGYSHLNIAESVRKPGNGCIHFYNYRRILMGCRWSLPHKSTERKIHKNRHVCQFLTRGNC